MSYAKKRAKGAPLAIFIPVSEEEKRHRLILDKAKWRTFTWLIKYNGVPVTLCDLWFIKKDARWYLDNSDESVQRSLEYVDLIDMKVYSVRDIIQKYKAKEKSLDERCS